MVNVVVVIRFLKVLSLKMNLENNLIKKPINYFSIRNFISLFIIVAIFFFDRITKIKIIEHQENNPGIFINDYLNLELVWNNGVGFGLLNFNVGYVYHIISLLIFIIIIVIFIMIINADFLNKVFYSFLLGGAIGNFYDRMHYFSVPDFIDFHINNYHWFTFNIADIFISIGIMLLIFNEIILRKNEKN
jgi:signal peptidase II|tara:strand:+ start:64 stop:630 length:567 start_codon:yes stop_codon:yes gene_type:complete